MLFAIELFFDEETDRGIRGAWEVLREVSGAGYLVEMGVVPHVALAVFEARDVAGAERVFELCGGGFAPFRLRVEGVGSFAESGVVFLGVEAAGELGAAQGVVERAVREAGLEMDARYARTDWVPHCTLAMGVEAGRMERAVAAAREVVWEAPFRVESLALVSFPPTRVVRRVRLGEGGEDGMTGGRRN